MVAAVVQSILNTSTGLQIKDAQRAKCYFSSPARRNGSRSVLWKAFPENETLKFYSKLTTSVQLSSSVRKQLVPFAAVASSTPADVQATSKKELGPLRIIVVGAPGSGKGTQCKLVGERLGLVHVSAGDVLRAAVAAGTEMGLRAKEGMDKGELVPTDVAVSLVKERLEEDDCCEEGWLLDGYPRSMSQFEGLSSAGVFPELVILLEVDDDDIVERVVGRRQDPETGRIYHLTYDPPENEEVAARLTQRSDDTEEACRTRLRIHHENVDLICQAYKDVIKMVDGNRDKMEVFEDVEALINQLRE